MSQVGVFKMIKRRARKTGLLSPLHLRPCARPGPHPRGREHPLDERLVEPRVVRDDDTWALDERARGLDVNPLSADVVVRQARQVRDLGRERAPGVVAVHLRLALEDLDDAPLEGVREGQHRELDDRVVRGAEPRGLAVDVEASAKLCIPRVREPPFAESFRQLLARVVEVLREPGLRSVRSRVRSPRTTHLPRRDAADGSDMANRRRHARGHRRRRPDIDQ